MVLSIIFPEDKHTIVLHLTIFYEYQQFFQHRICFWIQPQLQLVNLHRNRRYFVIKLHTWFCLIFLEDKYKILLHLSIFYEYQQFFSTPYLFLDTAARLQWPVTQISACHQFFLNNVHLSIFYEYQQFFQHRICFSTQPPDFSDPWPRSARATSFFLIMLFNK